MKIQDIKIANLPFEDLIIELETLRLETSKTLDAHKSFFSKQFKKFKIQFPASNRFLQITQGNVNTLEYSTPLNLDLSNLDKIHSTAIARIEKKLVELNDRIRNELQKSNILKVGSNRYEEIMMMYKTEYFCIENKIKHAKAQICLNEQSVRQIEKEIVETSQMYDELLIEETRIKKALLALEAESEDFSNEKRTIERRLCEIRKIGERNERMFLSLSREIPLYLNSLESKLNELDEQISKLDSFGYKPRNANANEHKELNILDLSNFVRRNFKLKFEKLRKEEISQKSRQRELERGIAIIYLIEHTGLYKLSYSLLEKESLNSEDQIKIANLRIETLEGKIQAKENDLCVLLDKLESQILNQSNRRKIRKVFNAMKQSQIDRKDERLKEEEREREFRKVKKGLKPRKAVKPSKPAFQAVDQYDDLLADLSNMADTNNKDKREKQAKEQSTMFKTNRKDDEGKAQQDSFLHEFSRTIHEMRKGDKCRYFFEKYI